jgi:hypothetical protein
MKRRLSQFLRVLSHLIGLYIAFSAFITMTDLSAVAATIPARLGFLWQALLMGATPILCIVACIAVFLAAPVGNSSQKKFVRLVGVIPVLGRYCLFAVIVCGLTLLQLQALQFRASFYIQSLKLPDDVRPASPIPEKIQRDVGDKVLLRWGGGEGRIFFRKKDRAAVVRALEREHVAVEE